jgi:RNA polymerase sigma-70 factor, ECF subfamily
MTPAPSGHRALGDDVADVRSDDEYVTMLALVARNGDPEDVEAFVRAVYTDVRRFVAYLAGAHQAEDLAQETFLRALGSLPGFAGRSSGRTWLLSIARRVVVDRFRSAASRPVVADEDTKRKADQLLHDRGIRLVGSCSPPPSNYDH